MNVAITMPQLGLTMTEGTISSWLKMPGDTVRKDEVIVAVSTDKVDMDVESTVDGVLKEVIVGQGQTVPVGTPLAYVAVAGDDSLSPLALEPSLSAAENEADHIRFVATPGDEFEGERPAESHQTGEHFRSGDIDNERVRASPRARRRAKQLGIDITTVKACEAGQRIVEGDLLKSIAARQSPASSPESRWRRSIADRMIESITTIPHFSLSVEVNAEQLVTFYESVREAIGRAAGTKLTYTDLLFKALGSALARVPDLNSAWENGTVIRRSAINLGVAVATDRGVTAPILTEVDRMTLQQLVVARSKIVEKARQNRLTFADLEGGVGTLSNLGMYCIDSFAGIISPGQSFILAIGKLRNRPWEDISLVIKPTAVLTLSVDHRVADGAAAAVFLERVVEEIQNPYRILLGAGNNG